MTNVTLGLLMKIVEDQTWKLYNSLRYDTAMIY